ncbi:MAG: EamA family transporter [Chthoniobacterales bacterium]|nr:EamA family transporter [Chthoniobacterales bacterium]
MSALAAFLIFLSVSCFVAGQILLKHAMDITARETYSRLHAAGVFAVAIAAFAINFFVNIGLLQRFDLSYFFPFQGLSVIFIAFAGAWILKEKLSLRLTIGSIVIAAGVVLVSLS